MYTLPHGRASTSAASACAARTPPSSAPSPAPSSAPPPPAAASSLLPTLSTSPGGHSGDNGDNRRVNVDDSDCGSADNNGDMIMMVTIFMEILVVI